MDNLPATLSKPEGLPVYSLETLSILGYET